MPGPGSMACPKPTRKVRLKAERTADRLESDRIGKVRSYVIGRERGRCRCCRRRRAESMDEMQARGAGGKISKRNSIAVCGQLVGVDPSCHTYLQANQITAEYGPEGAEGIVYFTPTDQKRADWLHIKFGERIESAPMRSYEDD